MANFFIDRPVFAWVIALFMIIAGAVALTQLPIEQYPSVAAPKITISSTYPGASAQTHQDAVLTLIENQMNGLEGLDYIESKANANGTGQITLTFKGGTDETKAQMDVQNRLSIAEARLPQAVRDNGLIVSKANNNFLLFTMLFSDNAQITTADMSDYAMRNIVPELQRLEGVGNIQLFGAERAMRIWIDPDKLKNYELSNAQVASAIREQNTQISAGSLGALPNLDSQRYSASVIVPAQLQTPEAFGNIVVKSSPNGASVRLADIARIELGSQSYEARARLNGQPATGIGVQLANTGNAVSTAKAVKEKMTELAQYFPDGMHWDIPYDSSTFVNISIEEVLHTLIEAIILVFIVMYLFLQNIRYTIIPTIVVPISLLGAVLLMLPLGLSINVLTLFAMVLVIGIVVDDAIVVVENVERLMVEEGLSPNAAAHKGMTQITGAVIGITVVLISVFIPMAFFSGATGNIYRQFALVMASAIGFSAFLALSLTPALCATLLKPVSEDHHEKRGFFGAFNRGFKRSTHTYEGFLAKLIRRSFSMLCIYAALAGVATWIYFQLPSSFLPNEDQGTLLVNVQLPSGATQQRTQAVMKQAEDIILAEKEVHSIVSVLGFSFSGQGQNMGLAFVTLKDWAERKAPGQDANSLSGRLSMKLATIREAFIFALNMPAIPELGVSSGFDMRLEDRGNQGHQALLNARNQLLGMASQNSTVTQVRPSGLEDATQLELTIDRNAAALHSVSISQIATTLSTALGSAYLGDFPNQGRMQRVVMMADANRRMQPEDINRLMVMNQFGTLVPMANLVQAKWITGPMQLNRYNTYPSMPINGSASPGYSSGDAMVAMTEMVKQIPGNFAVEWTGQSLEERRAGNQSFILYGFAMLAVFLCLAALYESWSIPFAVILVVPLGFLGVVSGIWLRGLSNDVYFQVGMITVIGLSAKNAILIVEFAKDLQVEGLSAIKAALQSAHLRFRPIIMTSLAFGFGVIPLFFASGAGAASQREIGTSVLAGMMIGTFFSVFLVPIFYVVVRQLIRTKSTKSHQ